MYTARSFDVNKPGARPDELRGGVIGGSLKQGILSVGDVIEIRPGMKREEHGKEVYEPMFADIYSIVTGGSMVKKAGPGGLLGLGTGLDPALTKADTLAGRVIGLENALPPTLHEFEMDVHLLKRIVGFEKEKEIGAIKTNEPLMLTVGTATTVGIVTSARDGVVAVKLKLPVCAEKGQKVAISRRIAGRWRLIGYGEIK